jgi:drug/metabolite transporter (DMT)-like permease
MQAARWHDRSGESEVLSAPGGSGASTAQPVRSSLIDRLADWQLFALCVGVWGTTWHVITWQVNGSAPEFGVALRFGLAGLLVLAWQAWQSRQSHPEGRRRFGLREHALCALQGVFLYSLSYVCVYHAERDLPSGLVAVGYSASPLINGLAARVIWGVAVTGRFLAGGVMGVAGVAMIFAPEFGRAGTGQAVMIGVGFTAASVLLSSVGSLTASRNRSRGLPMWPALGWGMVYGGLSSLVVLAVVQGLGWGSTTVPVLPPSPLQAPAWWAALLYLAVAGSVLTFAAFLTLQDRVGPGPSSAVGVAAPVLAIAVSIALEGYQPGWETVLGVALAVLGNAWMLRPGGRSKR